MICNCDEEDPAVGWGDPVLGKHNHLMCGLCIPLLECGDCQLALPLEKIHLHYMNTGHQGEYAVDGKLVMLGKDGRLQLCPECGKPMVVPFNTEVLGHTCGHKIMSVEGVLSLLHLGGFKSRQHLQPSSQKQNGQSRHP